ncbi:hypothetical protein L0U85_17295 [Glycomyces sp. L485]|uniref:WXG100 family type VII secretion target n=1 Tax=Glycomyces sp. L485 TaxID=2909235 RepID=UPI001F4B3F30|nr:hypothetical protein [Glycomyces sp. L485]MCH7232595.1 hypothetical protein [Glycomyces sp. L485]
MAEGKGKGKTYYLSTYTHEELWGMLFEGDSWSVEAAGTVWSSAASGLQAAREEMGSHVLSLRTQWTGKAAEEFENRMLVIEQYSLEAEDGMKQAADRRIPALAQALETAKADAQSGDLYPSSTENYEEWLESQGIQETDADYNTKEPQYRQQYQKYLDDRHEYMAEIVANLGDVYADAKDAWEDPPPPPPSDMPGNTTYQPPTGGVFGNNGLNSAGSLAGPPGSDSSSDNRSGLSTTDSADLDPVEDWVPGSYTDVDSDITTGGGLASGGTAPIGGSYGTAVSTGGAGGGASLSAAGTGLFGPARGSTASPAPGRGTGANNSPARSGANRSANPSNTRGSGGGRGTGSNSSGRGTGRGMNRGMGPRGGTRSGYYDDDDEEETTRQTWLKEDDINWGDNRTSDEELDD